MSSREAILKRIRTALANDPPREKPPVPEVWPRENPSVEEMARRFQSELETVFGEVIRADSIEDGQRKLCGLLNEAGWKTVAALDRPLCREIVSTLPAERVAWAQSDWTPASMADLPVGMVEADVLLADTGTAMIDCGRPEERLMCYLPPACIIVARAERLVEHMPAAWGEIARRAADPQTRGEFVFITGPSRTADIEKILILGVHGPKRLIVLLIS